MLNTKYLCVERNISYKRYDEWINETYFNIPTMHYIIECEASKDSIEKWDLL